MRGLLLVAFLGACGPTVAPAAKAPEASAPAASTKAELVEYEGIHRFSPESSLLFPDYRCDPDARHPGLVLTFDDDYRARLESFRGDEPVIRVEVRLRGMLSATGSYGPDGKSPNRVNVVEILEMGPATVCE